MNIYLQFIYNCWVRERISGIEERIEENFHAYSFQDLSLRIEIELFANDSLQFITSSSILKKDV